MNATITATTTSNVHANNVIMSTLAGTAQMPRVAKPKTLVGNVAGNTTTAATTTATTTLITASTTTVTTKLSNQDNHNEYVAANADAKYLRHAMLGNFNQRNEHYHARLESCNSNSNSNNNNNNNDTSSCCGYVDTQQRMQQQPLLRLNKEMNDVNSMQATTTTTTTAIVLNEMNDVIDCMRILSNNNSCCRADSCIKMDYEGYALESDNEGALRTHLHQPPVRRHTHGLTTPTVDALSLAEISTSVSLLPAVFGSRQVNATTITPIVIHQEHLPLRAATLTAEPGLKSASGSKITNCAASETLTGDGRVSAPIICNKKRHLNARSGKRRRKRCKHKRRYHLQANSVRAEMESEMAKIKTAVKMRAIRSVTKRPKTLNSGVLTSFILNFALLALWNASAATEHSAVAATLGETINISVSSDPSSPSSANGIVNAYENGSVANDNSSYIGSQIASANGGTSDISFNESDTLLEEDRREYIFDRTDVRIIFITLYILVFCCCFFGNLLVMLVVTLSRRLRSITNFFLANLAFADFCVGLFCVMQNLSIYLIKSWVFGEFLCQMYQFVHSLSYTASIFILVVICMERYFAIVHPITCKQILTATRLRLVISTVWITSAVYSTPKFLFSRTIKHIHTKDGHVEEICVLDRQMFNSKLLDMINFGLLYVIPLLVMTVLYSKIAIALWRSSHGLSLHLATQHQQQQQQQQQQDESMSLHNSMYHHQHSQHHNHNHHHHHHHHHQQQLQHNQHLPYNHRAPHTTTTLHNINHQHNHLQQTQAEQQLPGAELTHTAAVGVVGMGSLNGCSAGGGGVVATNMTSGLLSRRQSSTYERRGVSITESQYEGSQVSLDSERPIVSACRNGSNNNGNGSSGGISGGSMNSTHRSSFMQHQHHTSAHPHPHQRARVTHMSHSSNNVLRARRGVVRMLIIFVLTFALCNLPYHARKMWQYWSRSYRGDSNFNALLTPLTFLVTYFNSGINPLLYAFLSRNFRKGMKELLLCSWKKAKGKSSSNSSMHHKRVALQTHSLPTDTTHIGNEQL